MKVVFMEEVEGTARVGDVKNVADGFARNYLLPRRLAAPATDHYITIAAARAEKEVRRQTRLDEEAQEHLVPRMEGQSVTIEVRVGEQGKLFGSVTARDIAEALQEATSVELEHRQVDLRQPIREVGSQEVTVKLTRNVHVPVTVNVEPLGGMPEVEEAEEAPEGAEEPETEAAAAEAQAEPVEAQAEPVEAEAEAEKEPEAAEETSEELEPAAEAEVEEKAEGEAEPVEAEAEAEAEEAPEAAEETSEELEPAAEAEEEEKAEVEAAPVEAEAAVEAEEEPEAAEEKSEEPEAAEAEEEESAETETEEGEEKT